MIRLLGPIAVALIGLGVAGFAEQGGGAPLESALLLIAAAILAAVAALLAVGLTRRPILGLSVPLLAGWWCGQLQGLDASLAAFAAAVVGGLAGALLGLVAAAPAGAAAAATLTLALLADIASDGLSLERLGAAGIGAGFAPLGLAAVLALGFAWWTRASLAAGWLGHAARRPQARSLGLRPAPLLILAGLYAGAAAGVGGVAMAAAGASPPTAATGLVLAAAAFAGGGTVAGTLAVVVVIWLWPQLGLLASPAAPDPELALAAVAVALTAALLFVERHRRDDDG